MNLISNFTPAHGFRFFTSTEQSGAVAMQVRAHAGGTWLGAKGKENGEIIVLHSYPSHLVDIPIRPKFHERRGTKEEIRLMLEAIEEHLKAHSDALV
jgi:hypothetical protein